MAITSEELWQISKIQDARGREYAKFMLAEKIASKEDIKLLVDEYDSLYRNSMAIQQEFKALKEAIEDGPKEVGVSLMPLSDGCIIARRRSGSLPEKLHTANGFDVKPGDPIFVSQQGLIVGVGDTALQDLLVTDEARVVEVLPGGVKVKLDYGLNGGEQIAILSEELRKHAEELKAGMPVLCSRSLNMVFRIGYKAEADNKPVEIRDNLVFAGFEQYRRDLEDYLIYPMSQWQHYDGMMPIILVIAGVTGLGKTHGVLWAMQEVSKLLGIQANVRMLSPAHLRISLFAGTERRIKEECDGLVMAAESGIPSVLLLNEGEVMVSDRTLHANSSVRSTLDAAVGTVLATIDLWRDKHKHLPLAMVITTNFPEVLDPAFLNDHRLSRLITLDYPETIQEIEELVAAYVPEGNGKREIVQNLTDKIMSSPLIRVTDEHGVAKDIDLGEMCSPALISGICGSAKHIITGQAVRSKKEIKKIHPSWDHYSKAAEQRIGDLAKRLAEVRITREMLPIRISEQMGRIVKVQAIYKPDLI